MEQENVKLTVHYIDVWWCGGGGGRGGRRGFRDAARHNGSYYIL